MPGLASSRSPDAGMALSIKAAVDRVAAFVGLVLTMPLLLVLAVGVRLFCGRPVLFRQVRPGLRGAPFELVKFRTMEPGEAGDAERLTPFGRWLRSTSLDELPELWNVLRGEMSLVGPRPLLMQYLDHYTKEQMRRHDMRPGVTGWTQVNGRNALTWDDKFALDVWYVDHWSLLLDLRILVKTVGVVLTKRGVSAKGDATMPEFRAKSDGDGQAASRSAR